MTSALVRIGPAFLPAVKGSRDELIRLALGPDGEVAPDVRARAPGRGAWIGIGRAALDEANAKGKLKGALQRAFKTQALTIPADLGERIEAALRQTALDRLGMEARSSNLITARKRSRPRPAPARSTCCSMPPMPARTAGASSTRPGGSAAAEPAGADISRADRTILSMALGRENVVHVALTDPAAAARVRHALARWRDFM